MRTQKYIQVEAIVAKYKTLAANTKAVKKAEALFTEFFVPKNYMCTQFTDQLIGYIYQLRSKDDANSDVVKEYAEATSFYISGLLDDSEEQFLVDNYELFVDYAFDHSKKFTLGSQFDVPREWSCLVPYLLDNPTGKVFIAHSDDGREFVGFNHCELMVADGYENAAIRALACGLSITPYKQHDIKAPLWSDLDNEIFDSIVIDIHSGGIKERSIEECFEAAIRIIKDGGDILICVSKEALLSEDSVSLRSYVMHEKSLCEVIQLPSGNLLLHIVKRTHDSFVMCDASQLFLNNNERVLDVEAFKKEVKMANKPERNENPIICRYAYDKLNANILLPAYYLHFPENGTALREVFSLESDLVLSDNCALEDKVVTVNQLATIFSKSAFKVENLPSLNQGRLRRYYRVNGPSVIMAVSDHDIAIGYTTDSGSFLVPHNLYALKPVKDVDVKYLASKLLCGSLKEQLVTLVYGKGIAAKLTTNWSDLILVDLQTAEEQQSFVQESMQKDFAMQEDYVATQEKGFKHAIRLRKHALSQNISAFDSLFRSLEFCMKEHKGHLKASDQLSPISQMTVGEAMETLNSNLSTICERVTHLTDDNDWGKCEAIEPQEFIEDYERQHADADFKFVHLWEDFETNHFTKDILDRETGKLLFHKGESINAAWFPRKALKQVFDNIMSNACEHGFKDKSRNDYVIQTNWDTNGLNMVIKISNNGMPISSEVSTDLILEYGYTTALNQRGHGGIGGGEISEIMHKYGGDVNVISTPDKNFVVTYELTLPMASVY